MKSLLVIRKNNSIQRSGNTLRSISLVFVGLLWMMGLSNLAAQQTAPAQAQQAAPAQENVETLANQVRLFYLEGRFPELEQALKKLEARAPENSTLKLYQRLVKDVPELVRRSTPYDALKNNIGLAPPAEAVPEMPQARSAPAAPTKAQPGQAAPARTPVPVQPASSGGMLAFLDVSAVPGGWMTVGGGGGLIVLLILLALLRKKKGGDGKAEKAPKPKKEKKKKKKKGQEEEAPAGGEAGLDVMATGMAGSDALEDDIPDISASGESPEDPEPSGGSMATTDEDDFSLWDDGSAEEAPAGDNSNEQTFMEPEAEEMEEPLSLFDEAEPEVPDVGGGEGEELSLPEGDPLEIAPPEDEANGENPFDVEDSFFDEKKS